MCVLNLERIQYAVHCVNYQAGHFHTPVLLSVVLSLFLTLQPPCLSSSPFILSSPVISP